MILREFTMARSATFGTRTSLCIPFFQILATACCLGLLVVSLHAKEASAINAIALFEGPNGAASVQISGLMVNGKTELRGCDGVSKFDKKIYDKMPRIQIQGAPSLERGQDGVLMLASASGSACIVPSGLRFDKNAEFTTTEAAEQAVLSGTVVGASARQASELPPVKPGLRLVFVPAPDTELAEYLRAGRVHTVAGWREFL